jgi:ribose-phosphate pyrophosphokinase
MAFRSICIFSGGANIPLAREICDYLQLPLGTAKLTRFSDGEIFVEVNENVRGVDAYVIQPTCAPVNDHLLELLIMVDALKRASAGNVTAVMPYYGYARQDRKSAPRTPITSKLVADLLVASGVGRVLGMDLHAAQIQGFFDIPFDHLFAMPVLLGYLKERYTGGPGVVIVSPDAGGVERARAYAKRLNANLGIIDKRRDAPNQSEVMHIVGDVRDKTVIIIDDMVDTAGTLTQGAEALRAAGAARVVACATHPVLSGPAVERIEDSCLEELVVTNSIPLTVRGAACEKIKQLSVARLLGEAVKRIHNSDSVSSLFV